MVSFHRKWFIDINDINIMQQEMERLLDHFASSKPPSIRFSPSAWQPSIDVYETENKVVINIELAGVRESDIEIMIANNTFTIRGERERELSESGKSVYHQLEIASGPFQRSVDLPVAVNATEAKVIFKDGLIIVLLPKVKEQRILQARIKSI